MRRLLASLLLATACGSPSEGRVADPAPPIAATHASRHPGGGVRVAAGALQALVEPSGAVRLAAGTAELVLETRAIGRGVSEPSRAAGVAVEGDGAAIDRGVARETITPSGRGVQQAWRFASAPPGAGDLEVTVEPSAPCRRRQGEELDCAGFRYGAASWIDAAGERTPLRTTLRDGAIVLTVPAAVLSRSRFPAVLDPDVEPMVDLDTTPVYRPAREPQWDAAIASDGVDALIAWHDERQVLFEAFGTGMSGAGVIQQPGNVLMTRSGSYDLALVYLDTDATGVRKYVLLWSTLFDLNATPIDMDDEGAITVGQEISLYVPPPGRFVNSLAAAGGPGHYLVLITEGNAGGNDAVALLFDDDHAPLVPAQPLYPAVFPNFNAAVTFDTTHYLVLSAPSGGGMFGRVISSVDLGVLDTFLVVDEVNDPSDPALAHNGNGSLGVWVDRRTGVQVYARRMGEGGLLGPEIVVAPSNSFAPTVAGGDSAANEFLLAWLRDGVVEGELVGGVIDGDTDTVVATANAGYLARRPAVANVGGDGMCAFDNGDNSPLPEHTDLFAARFDGLWQVQPTLVSQEANEQTRVAIDANAAGTAALAAWTDNRAAIDNTNVYARLTGSDGAPTGMLLQLSNHPDLEGDADVAAGDGEWLVVFRRGDDTGAGPTSIEAVLVDAGGVVTDAVTLTGTELNQRPRVVFDGTDYLVTWERGALLCESMLCQYVADLPALVRLPTGGGSLGAATSYDAAETGIAPNLARDGAGALWVWEHRGDLSAARVPAGGAPGASFVVNAAAGRQTRPAAAMADGRAFVVWEDDRDGGSQIFLGVVEPDDSAIEVGAVSGAAAAFEPEIVDAADGYSVLVVWDGSAFGAAEQVWGAFVKKSTDDILDLIDPAGRQLTLDPLSASRRPDVTALGAGRLLVGFDGMGAERTPRARTLVVDSGDPDGTACDAADDCASRFCFDGVCCQELCNGTCRRCGSDGVCEQVASDSDDTCFGERICDAGGFCRNADGEECEEAGDCASGFCVDDICCATACEGACDKCNAAGQCIPQFCAPYGCDEERVCLGACSESRDCAPGYQCVGGECVTPVDLRVVDPGCSCRAAGRGPFSPGWLLLLLGVAGARRRLRARR